MEHTDAKQAMKELTMALLYLSRFCEWEKFSEAKDFYAWKGYDFDVLNLLAKRIISVRGSILPGLKACTSQKLVKNMRKPYSKSMVSAIGNEEQQAA